MLVTVPEREIPASLRDELAALHDASWGWALACCDRRAEDAEDALQSAYAKVLSGEARFDGRSSFKTWLFGVIRWTARSQRRRAWLRALGLARARSPIEVAPSVEVVSEERARARAVVDAMRALSERQREVLHLVFYEGMTVREAADVMGVSAGTASLHYDRGKQKMAELLRRAGLGDGP